MSAAATTAPCEIFRATIVYGVLLTADEMKILRLMLLGKGPKEIAWEMHVARTTYFHWRLKPLREKLGLSTNQELLMWAARHLEDQEQ